MAEKNVLSVFDNLESAASKVEKGKNLDLKSVKLVKALIAKARHKKDKGDLAINILNLSDSERKKVAETIAKLESDMKTAQAVIDKDKANIQKLKALL